MIPANDLAPAPAITHHSDVVRQKTLAMLQRPFEHRVYRKAARAICNSPTYAAGSPLLKRFADKVRVVPMGLDPGPFLNPSAARAAADLRAAHGGPLWLSVGRLVYYKGLANAVAARYFLRRPEISLGFGASGLT